MAWYTTIERAVKIVKHTNSKHDIDKALEMLVDLGMLKSTKPLDAYIILVLITLLYCTKFSI